MSETPNNQENQVEADVTPNTAAATPNSETPRTVEDAKSIESATPESTETTQTAEVISTGNTLLKEVTTNTLEATFEKGWQAVMERVKEVEAAGSPKTGSREDSSTIDAGVDVEKALQPKICGIDAVSQTAPASSPDLNPAPVRADTPAIAQATPPDITPLPASAPTPDSKPSPSGRKKLEETDEATVESEPLYEDPNAVLIQEFSFSSFSIQPNPKKTTSATRIKNLLPKFCADEDLKSDYNEATSTFTISKAKSPEAYDGRTMSNESCKTLKLLLFSSDETKFKMLPMLPWRPKPLPQQPSPQESPEQQEVPQGEQPRQEQAAEEQEQKPELLVDKLSFLIGYDFTDSAFKGLRTQDELTQETSSGREQSLQEQTPQKEQPQEEPMQNTSSAQEDPTEANAVNLSFQVGYDITIVDRAIKAVKALRRKERLERRRKKSKKK